MNEQLSELNEIEINSIVSSVISGLNKNTHKIKSYGKLTHDINNINKTNNYDFNQLPSKMKSKK